MKALKKTIATLLTALLLVTGCAFTASAAPAPETPATATTVSCYCETPIRDFTYYLATRVAANANDAIADLVADAQASSHPNIPRLIHQTEAISATASAIIEMLGYDAECQYETYEIGGQLVEIDPIIVIKRTGTTK